MKNHCGACEASFSISDGELDLLAKLSPTIAGQTYPLPVPQLCPECRHQRRLACNNEMKLYHRKCDATGEPVISIFSSDKPFPVYKSSYWWGDKWEPLDYGREFDFSRTFFEQWHEMFVQVPQAAVRTNHLLDENSDYTNYAGSNKNCYLIFHADLNRDCYYGYGVKGCESCLDVFNAFNCELCYECVDCRKCYDLKYSQDCVNCNNSAFLDSCIACNDCIGCKNLYQKRYCVLNRQMSKAEYEAFKKELNLSSRSGVKSFTERFEKFLTGLPSRCLQMVQTEESFGDHLFQCRNVEQCFDVDEMREAFHCYQTYSHSKDCMDLYQFGLNAELVYECSIVGYNAQRVLFSHLCNEQVNELLYCQACHHSSSLFGCLGVRHKQYCILNKQYSKAEYESLLPKIIEHMEQTEEWGEFFPAIYSAFGYNETTAQEVFPLTEAVAKRRGLQWHRPQETGSFAGASYHVADSIADVHAEIHDKVLTCEVSGKPYKIIPPELKFYMQHGIPVPSCSPEERHRARRSKRNPQRLRVTKCDSCSEKIWTNFPKDAARSIYCENCYQRLLA